MEMLLSEKLQKQLNKTWTAQDVAEFFNVCAMTVHNWRASGCPAIDIEGTNRPAVRFIPQEVEAWHRKYILPRQKKAA